MSIDRFMVILTFAVGVVPIFVLTFLFGFRTKWRSTVAGRAVFYLMAVTSLSYILTLTVLIFPHIFDGDVGQFVRIAVRFAIACVFWNLLRLFIIAQRAGAAEERRTSAEALAGLEKAKAYIDETENAEAVALFEKVNGDQHPDGEK